MVHVVYALFMVLFVFVVLINDTLIFTTFLLLLDFMHFILNV